MEKTQSQTGHIDHKKRAPDDSASDSPESKIRRVHSAESQVNSSDLIQIPVESDDSHSIPDGPSDNSVDSSNAKWIQDDLLNFIDESDESAIQGLDSVIKSFEEEILLPTTAPETMSAAEVNFSDGSQPDLGYLLEASDDELGLPPTFPSGEEGKIRAADLIVASGSEASFVGEMLALEDAMQNYNSFEFEMGCDSDGYNGSYDDSGDFVSLGGLFDHSDGSYAPAEMWAL
ncbi:hypothetical protein K2173_028240 [Erythroxylum novogranatense]|uniref:Uncharacterized protein n=1 Tax=Erythroxylum novogranatense TaxID=1862640 RepID=A0AAV8U3Z8_9ROSI|nr:hypothetical protein K2173_028240 [Erythroxylum novogranatense]